MSEQWLSIIEYARKFSVSDMTVRRRIKTGKIRATLRDGKYYIPVGGQSMAPHQSRPVAGGIAAGEGDAIVIPQNISPADTSVNGREKLAQSELQQICRLNAKMLTELEEARNNIKALAAAEIATERERNARLQAEITHHKQTINDLSQKIADLQLLVSILEKNQVRSHAGASTDHSLRS